MLLPTLLIIVVNLALGFVVAAGRELRFTLRLPSRAAKIDAASPQADPPSEPPLLEQPAIEPPAENIEPTPEEATDVATNDDMDSAENAADPAEEDEPPNDTSAVDEPEASSGDENSDESPAEPASHEVSTDEQAADDAAAAENATDDDSEPIADEADENIQEDDGQGDEATSSAATNDDATDEPRSVAVEVASSKSNAELPTEWFDVLKDIEKEGYGKCQSFVEASTQVMRLEVGRYRGELVQLDGRIRSIYKNYDVDALATAIADLERVNAEWLERQGEAVGHLASRRDDLGELQSAGQRLEDVLLDQTAQIESSCSNIKQLDFAGDREGSRRRLFTEVCRLVDMAHVLRDQLHESMLAIMIGEKRMAKLDRRLHVDSLTGFVNRTGLEAALFEWWRDDPNRIRQLSLVMFDVVRLGRFNEGQGVATGDGLLEAVGKIIDGTLRKKRGCDFVARYSGQRFVVVLGDTGPRNATSAAERIRQMIAASTFEVDGEPVEVFVTGGVVEVLATDDSRVLVARLDKAVRLAKKLGRNTTALDEGKGPAAVENPPQFDAKGKVVRLQTA